jgi:hypothetical protein
MIYIFTLHDGHKYCTAAEKYGIRQLKAGSAAQPKGCSACFVLVFVRIVMGLCRKTEERCHSSLSIQAELLHGVIERSAGVFADRGALKERQCS